MEEGPGEVLIRAGAGAGDVPLWWLEEGPREALIRAGAEDVRPAPGEHGCSSVQLSIYAASVIDCEIATLYGLIH